MTDHVQIPSSPSERNKIQKAINEMALAMKAIEDKRSYINDTAAMLKEKHDFNPKLAKKLATAMHKHNFADLQTEYENFETAYETLVEGRQND